MRSLLGVGFIFVTSSCYLYYLSTALPSLDHQNSGLAEGSVNNASSGLKFPSNLEELRWLAELLKKYCQDHYDYVWVLFCSAYLYKQTWAIPGSVFLNILAGALFGPWFGFPLVCVLSATGATLCYLISKTFGHRLVVKHFPEKVESLQSVVEENLPSLFFLLLFLRLFPMTPNWFLNISSPIVGVPIGHFFFSVLIGLMPYNFICVQTGGILSSIESIEDVFSARIMLQMLGAATVALLPGIFLKMYKPKLKTS